MNEIIAYFRDLPSGDLALWGILVFLLIAELLIHRSATRKPPLI